MTLLRNPLYCLAFIVAPSAGAVQCLLGPPFDRRGGCVHNETKARFRLVRAENRALTNGSEPYCTVTVGLVAIFRVD